MFNYTEKFSKIHINCLSGKAAGIDYVMAELNIADLPTTRAVDYYLSFVESSPAVERIEHFLFKGTRIQRNYCTLYFARRNEWDKVNKAYKLGLIDAIQAYSR